MMYEATERAVERGQQHQHDAEVGQANIFGMMNEDAREEVLEESYPDADAWSDRELLDHERDLLGFYVTGHPLDRHEGDLNLYNVTDLEQVAEGRDLGEYDDVTVAGVVSEMSERALKSGDGRMAFVTLEDKTGRVEILVFSNPFEQYEDVLKSGEPILLKGNVMVDGDGDAKSYKLRADEIIRLMDARKQKVKQICIDLDVDEVTDGELHRLKRLFAEHPGHCHTSLEFAVDDEEGAGRATLRLPETYAVEPTNDLLMQIDRIFGREVVSLHSGRRR
jgi:DNA polymerase-3 subunit alpha